MLLLLPFAIRYMSLKDVQVIVGHGCPSLDRKVVNSGKRLRAHVGIDEGNVCFERYFVDVGYVFFIILLFVSFFKKISLLLTL